jgi:regulator of protease activity HflC (stomatin/prohibitin superfamily)
LHYIAPKPGAHPDAAETRRERVRHFGFAAAVGVLLALNLAGIWKAVLGIDTAATLTVVAGYRIFYNAVSQLPERKISADVAICIAVIAALAVGEYLAAAGAMFVMLAGEGLESYAAGRTEAAIHRFVEQLRRLVAGGEISDGVVGRTEPWASQFLTGDRNISHMRVAVQYSVGVPADYPFRTDGVARAAGAAVESALAERISSRAADAMPTTGKAAIHEEVRDAAQRLLNHYGAGVISSTMNPETVTPPPEAAEAFRDAAGARADSSRIVNQSMGYAHDAIPKARGRARGDAARFTQVAAEYSRAAGVNGRRICLETMEQALPRSRKPIVGKNGSLDLTIIRKGDSPAARK